MKRTHWAMTRTPLDAVSLGASNESAVRRLARGPFSQLYDELGILPGVNPAA
jgi:hypothetical protein